MKLSEVKEGSTVKIARISAYSDVKKVLCEIGLSPGRSVKVLIKRDGMLVVSVGSSKFCLGRDVADFVLVEENTELSSHEQNDTGCSDRSSELR